jgi:5-methyltetrahydrofolate--homocysteine methyltransferase
VRFADSPPPWWLVAVAEAQSRRTNMLTLAELSQAIEKGNRNEAKRLTQELLNAGATPLDIVEKGLVPGMAIVGEKFKNNQIFVPEILLAARAMKEAMALLEPLLARAGIKPKYTAVIGTVQGDLHDIGKNLVAMMWKGANFGVVDLGTNVPPEKFVAAAREHNAQIIGLSALLTTTMLAMKTTVRAIRGAGLNSVKIIVGGAPITQEFAREIGADGYGSDAATAVEVVRQLVAA